MNDSLSLGRVRGIPVGLHWSLFVFGALVATNLAGFFFPSFAPGLPAAVYLVAGVIAAALLSISILAHEFGHAFMARKHGVRTEGITLWLLGGVARLVDEPRTARHAFDIAVAGPAVSVVIGVASGLTLLFGSLVGLPAVVLATLGYLAVVNLGLAVFNMLPALPLDGGRALQAWKWHRNGDRDVATVEAAELGRKIGWGMGALGMLQLFAGVGNGFWTVLLAFFVVFQANGERRRAEHRIAMRNRPAAADPFDMLRRMMGITPPPAPKPAPAQADLIVIDPDDVRPS